MNVKEFTIHCPAKECINRIWNRNQELFKHLNKLRDLLYEKDPDFIGDEWDILDSIEHLAFSNQPDICDITHELTK